MKANLEGKKKSHTHTHTHTGMQEKRKGKMCVEMDKGSSMKMSFFWLVYGLPIYRHPRSSFSTNRFICLLQIHKY